MAPYNPLGSIPVPPPEGSVNWGGGVSQAFPAVGLASLAQGMTNGIMAGHDWAHQAGQLEMQKQQMANEAAWREQQAQSLNQYRQGELSNRSDLNDIRQTVADLASKKFNAEQAPPAPIQIDPSGKFYWQGRGWRPMPGLATAEKEAQKTSSVDDSMKSLSDSWDALGAGKSTAGATLKGTELWAQSKFPSTAAGQYDAAAQAFAGKLDHELLGRVNDVTIANAKKAIPGFYDTPESKGNKLKFIKDILGSAQKTPATGVETGPAAPGHSLNLADPRIAVQVSAIKQQYGNGSMSKLDAEAALAKLESGQGQ